MIALLYIGWRQEKSLYQRGDGRDY